MPNSGIYQLKFDSSGGPVKMEVFVGQAQVGAYTVTEHDQDGRFRADISTGNNIDNLPDRYDLPTAPEDLNGVHIGWNIVVSSPDDSPGQLFFTRVTFTQDGRHLPGSPVERSGSFDGHKVLLGFARLDAA